MCGAPGVLGQLRDAKDGWGAHKGERGKLQIDVEPGSLGPEASHIQSTNQGSDCGLRQLSG